MTQQIASPEEVELFVKTAVDKLTAKGMSEDDALERVGAVLQKRAEELGMLPQQDQQKQAEYQQGAADAEALIQQAFAEKQAADLAQQSAEGLSAEEYVLGSAHEKLVKSGMSEEEATKKLIAHLSE